MSAAAYAPPPFRQLARHWKRMRLERGRLNATHPAAANAALNAAEIRHRKTRITSTPLTIQLATTLACNLRCPFCRRENDDQRAYINSLDDDGRNLPWDVVEQVLEIAPHALNFTLTPLGEPTLYRHWERLLDKCREIGLDNLDMTSNATRLPDALCEKIIRAGFRTIFFSIDSDEPETFAKFRVGATLDKVEEGLGRLNAWKQRLNSPTPELRIASTFNRENIEHLPSLVDFAARHGATELIVQKMEIYEKEDPVNDLTLHRDLTRRMVEEAQRRASAHGIQLRVHFALLNQVDEAAHVEGAATSSAAIHTGQGAPQLTHLCTHPWHFCVIDTNADVRPCCWAAVKYGNLRENTFDEVWNGEVAQQMRADFLAGRMTPGCLDKHCGVSKRWDEVRANASSH